MLSSVFYAKLLTDWTEGFNLWPTLHLFQSNQARFWQALIPLALVILNIGCVIESSEYISNEAELAVYQVAEYFYNNVDSDALVETYDSELHFLLRQPIHYPPDEVQIDLNRRTFLKQPISILYDPLIFNPQYLVIGPRGEGWQLYEPVVQSNEFQLVQEFLGYRIFKRVH